jgi:hypothetical protein
VLVLSTAACGGSRSVAEQPPEPSGAHHLCEAKVEGVTQVDVRSVESLESMGPNGTTRPVDGPFVAYEPNELVALCLQPTGSGRADVWGIVVSDPKETAVKLWTQSPDDRFEWPT